MSREEETAIETEELYSEILPLKLIRSQQIPPSPNTSESAIDWLHDFSGFSWIAYGAASLLVISHSPSPLPQAETDIGSFFRQVIELPCSCHGAGIVSAVAWSPSRPSRGDLAVGVENLICLFSASSGNVPGSFCWKQTARLVQTSKVEAIKWSGSGDGLIAAGLEVVIWKKKEMSWEIAWKSRMELPQALVSATWSIEGPIATAAHVLLDSGRLNHEESTSMSREAIKRVLVFHSDGKSGFVTVELCHPQPTSMIQWRPLTRLSALHSRRDVLLTCCLDGAVRLWSEIDSGRSRKSGKDTNDQKAMRRSFHVISVIETSQSLKGNPGSEFNVTWAVEIGSKIAKAEGVEQWVSSEASEYDIVSRCEWLIGVGPGMSLVFWAVHCLDEISPVRFPRVTLWKKLELVDFTAGHVRQSNSKNRPTFVKAVLSRTQPFSPPTTCSLLQLLPDNSFSWLHLYSPTLNNTEDVSLTQPSKEKSLACSTGGFLSMDGHCGNILQVDVHPYSCDVEVAVSLDSTGSVLFWSLPTISDCISCMPMLDHRTWKFLGKVASHDLSMRVEYSCLRWAPLLVNENPLLLMGHAGGIDCFIVKISEIEGSKISCHKICTIPFTDCSHGDGPDEIFAMPLPSTCRETFISNHMLLFGIWTKEFCALSWEMVCHSDDLSGISCGCSFNAENLSTSKAWRSESTFDGEKYCVIANPCSSKHPDSHNCDLVTSVAVVCPDRQMPAVQLKWASSNGLWSKSSAYQMATGCSDGNLKLWRITSGELSTTHSDLVDLRWELVGIFPAHQGPVSMISLSSCGGKIATISMGSQGSANDLHIWESSCLMSTGNFLLVEKISFDGAVITLEWLEIGNGQLLLGVCLQNELLVYAQLRCVGEISVSSGKSSEMPIWSCVASGCTYPAACDFLWGPRATPVVVHERYFSLFSQWSFGTDRKQQAKFYCKFPQVIPADCTGEIDEGRDCAIYTDSSLCNIKERYVDEKSEACESMIPVDINAKNKNKICNFCLKMSQQPYHSGANSRLYNVLDIAEKLCGSLPIYHPKALFLYLSSGNWKRAYVALRHLTRHLNSKDSSVACGKGHNSGKSNYIIPQIHLTEWYEEISSTNTWDKGLQGGDIALRSSTQSRMGLFQLVDVTSVDNSPESGCAATFGKSEISGFITTLEASHDVATITNTNRSQLLAIVDLLGEVSGSCNASAYESFDEPGRRFWVAVRFQKFNFSRKFGRTAAAEELVIDSGLIAWAFQSDCQDSLLSSVLSNEPSWMEMRNLGVGYWFTSATQLRSRMEKLARLQYLKKKDPKDCALLYLALNRLQVLAGLFKISKDEKDKPLVGFLSRNFQEEKNKAAALKNAYVLMGRHQLELAIAFFLLGGDPSSAVTVCAKNFGDEQLALVICRLVEGYGGALEHELISNILLPAATKKGDYWLASLLEWVLGNYSQSFMNLLGFQMDAAMNMSAIPCKYPAFSDPNIGQYCTVLATKNSVKNSIGESTAAILARWARLMTTSALNRCGLPLEALECLSSISSTFYGKDQGSLSDMGKSSSLNGILKPSPTNASNWLLGDVACCLESNAKLNLAMQYIAKLLTENPSWPDATLASSGALTWREMDEIRQDELLVEKFEHKLHTGLSVFGHKYSLNSFDLINKILVFTSNNGLLFLGYHMLHGYMSRHHLHDKQNTADGCCLYPGLPKLFLKAIKEVTYLLARYVVACSIPCSALTPTSTEENVCSEKRHSDLYFQRIIYSIGSLIPFVQLYGSVFCTEHLEVKTFNTLDRIQFCVHFASAWLVRNTKGLVLMIQPILNAFSNGLTFSRIKETDLKKSMYQTAELMFNEASNVCGGKHEESGSTLLSEDERWQLICTCLWRHLYNISKNQFSGSIPEDGSSSMPLSSVSSMLPSSENCKPDGNSTRKLIKLLPMLSDKLLITMITYISASLAKQLVSFLRQKVEMGLPVPILAWLEESSQSQTKDISKCLNQGIDSLKLINNDSGLSAFEILWEVSVDPRVISESFVEEKVNYFQPISQKLSNGWKDVHNCIMAEYENADDKKSGIKSGSDSNLAGSPARNRNPSSNSFLSSGLKRMSALREVSFFQNPKEIYKTNGELLEALCINSIDQQKIALATNRKGILFFNLKAEGPYKDQAEYIWSESNWPQNGWAGSESTPVPTFVSPGIGLGSKKGAHLGLGGATIGLGSLARPGRDMTGGGAFGIPGYAGMGASGLGWGEQEDFEEFVDPPATIESIRTRALSSHPSRPFFLVGSSNTHVYLWEFGKDRATATYGVLPAANVPPPYALASISALQFDHCGQRFATAALDGTVCTWQLEVGGRSNVRPTESSLCFNSHASDVAFVSASGSILAVAGDSTNGVNVIIWDTLAPPVTSQASLVCHEGGARSLSVFDNYIGSTSVSPMIVTGGKSGDVGLHDFRYIATGKTKRHRHSTERNIMSSPTDAVESDKFGEQNQNGMLWYIPKAHQGSVTKISTVPNTSLFLTGSKDGDVKLWDAKRSELVFHWHKVHEKHTFLQPSSRGFGGFVRVAVTDIQVLPNGFLTCGGDGVIRQFQISDLLHGI